MKVAVYSSPHLIDKAKPYIEQLIAQLRPRAQVYMFEPFVAAMSDYLPHDDLYTELSDLPGDLDLMVSVGGDGTFLETITIVRDSNIPIVGINTGRLGFLANIPKDDISAAVYKLFNDGYEVEERELICLKSPSIDTTFPYAINDITVLKKDATMITVNVYVGEEFLNSYWADGLILATATGSTAYSLSVGGPILEPTANSLLLSPIAPHSLTVRPLVIPSNSRLTFEVECRGEAFLTTVDSKTFTVPVGKAIEIEPAAFKVRFVRLDGTSFYNTLRNKLMWGADRRK